MKKSLEGKKNSSQGIDMAEVKCTVSFRLWLGHIEVLIIMYCVCVGTWVGVCVGVCELRAVYAD